MNHDHGDETDENALCACGRWNRFRPRAHELYRDYRETWCSTCARTGIADIEARGTLPGVIRSVTISAVVSI